MDIQGYCLINKNAKNFISYLPLSEFINGPVRVMEFCVDGGVMVINAEATGLATFDKCDVVRSFKCGSFGEVVTPPGMNALEKMTYAMKANSRKGGYNYIVRQMVVASSLHKGEFSDSLIWQKQ